MLPDISKVAATMSDFTQSRIDGLPVSELRKLFECDLVVR